jgi:hypothetical protein
MKETGTYHLFTAASRSVGLLRRSVRLLSRSVGLPSHPIMLPNDSPTSSRGLNINNFLVLTVKMQKP